MRVSRAACRVCRVTGTVGALVSLSDSVNRVEVPKEWQKHSIQEGDEGKACTGPVNELITEEADLLTIAGLDPDEWMIEGKTHQWTKELPDGRTVRSFFFGYKRRAEQIDLPALYATARRKPRERTKKPTAARTTVPVIADIQAGKTGSRGGTPELIERLTETRVHVEAELKRRRPDSIFLPDVGDLIENFNSGGDPQFTNDLSLSQQMDLAATEIYEFVKLCARFAPVQVATVYSNHSAWRNGKQNLGRPGDDLGIFVHRQVEKVANAAGLDATWTFPPIHDEAHVVDVRTSRIGLVHGNQFAPGGAPLWWSKQQHGGQPVGSADILLSGHYHHLSILPTGRSSYTGRPKWWVQAPTLDNGSDWFRNKAGEDSDPGLLMFDVTDDGFDLQSLTVL